MAKKKEAYAQPKSDSKEVKMWQARVQSAIALRNHKRDKIWLPALNAIKGSSIESERVVFIGVIGAMFFDLTRIILAGRETQRNPDFRQSSLRPKRNTTRAIKPPQPSARASPLS